ncbi:methyltransferase domain-containing protein [Terrimonas sp. NA20]|uniref:Methyltransferase domain-containing protein n=1 Tax=Terrimonas ginsenosidimutans TaxID=2908004 RepID=A0ABS9KZI4_9BACT|nr:class I SAM-dependent methyltransferase [Terrimonas ginsenosidimutans]MCG2617716.1 methyltransferase domain-containing protein [Terrimonas ginsenosidimutans]
MPEIKWNASLYDNKHAFVSQYGEALIDWLQPSAGEAILDLGCGTGKLANDIAGFGTKVTGIDASAEMIEKAKASYPSIEFFVKDATDFSFEEKFDAIFSNATLHWIADQPATLKNVWNSLKPGGRFVFEMGGQHNVRSLVEALHTAAKEKGITELTDHWYFPSVATYAALLEKQGFSIQQSLYFQRDTKLDGEDGMKNWFNMFASFFFKHLPAPTTEKIINRAVEILRPTHYREGNWWADYVRLRMRAVKKV